MDLLKQRDENQNPEGTSLTDLILGHSPFEFREEQDDLIQQSDLPKMEKEFNHNIRKWERKKKREMVNGGVRQADRARVQALVGGPEDLEDMLGDEGGAGGGRRNRRIDIDENGFVIPGAMRNYEEKSVLGGLFFLRKCDRIDMFWGSFKNVERDLIRSFLFAFVAWGFMFSYIWFSTNFNEQKNCGNI